MPLVQGKVPMSITETATELGDAMMNAAHSWLDTHESKGDAEKVVGIVVAVCPDDSNGAEFAVGATHEIGTDAILEILLRVMNNLIPPESELRLVVGPDSEAME